MIFKIATLTNAQVRALESVESGNTTVIWHDRDYRGQGKKPWFSMSGGMQSRTLQLLWLAGLIRQDTKSGVYALATSIVGQTSLEVARARLTPEGRRRLREVREQRFRDGA